MGVIWSRHGFRSRICCAFLYLDLCVSEPMCKFEKAIDAYRSDLKDLMCELTNKENIAELFFSV